MMTGLGIRFDDANECVYVVPWKHDNKETSVENNTIAHAIELNMLTCNKMYGITKQLSFAGQRNMTLQVELVRIDV